MNNMRSDPRIELVENDFKELKEMLAKYEKTDIEVKFNESFRTIWFLGVEETDLYLRSSVDKYLTIARIMFANTHCGIGTKVFNWLREYAIDKGFEGIEVESTCTQEINNFCIKLGFKKVPYCGFYNDEGIFFGNYKLKFNEVI